MGEIRQHKFLLKEILDRFTSEVDRLEAALERLEAVAPHSTPPADPAAVEAADRYIRERTLELRGGVALDAE